MVETRGGRRFAIFFFVAAFLVLFLGRWLTPVDHFALTVASPFESLASSVGSRVGNAANALLGNDTTQTQLDQMRHEIQRLLKANVGMQTAEYENALLKRQLGFADKNPTLSLFPARVISYPSVLDESVLINKGTVDGLRDGMTVLDPYGYFAGHISDVASRSARVLLMSSPSSSIAGIDVTTRAEGLVEGQYAHDPSLKFVPTRDLLRPGDLVVTSGLYNLYPRNLVLGQIGAVRHSNVAISQSADLKPAADLNHLEFVMVVRNFHSTLPATLP